MWHQFYPNILINLFGMKMKFLFKLIQNINFMQYWFEFLRSYPGQRTKIFEIPKIGKTKSKQKLHQTWIISFAKSDQITFTKSEIHDITFPRDEKFKYYRKRTLSKLIVTFFRLRNGRGSEWVREKKAKQKITFENRLISYARLSSQVLEISLWKKPLSCASVLSVLKLKNRVSTYFAYVKHREAGRWSPANGKARSEGYSSPGPGLYSPAHAPRDVCCCACECARRLQVHSRHFIITDWNYYSRRTRPVDDAWFLERGGVVTVTR